VRVLVCMRMTTFRMALLLFALSVSFFSLMGLLIFNAWRNRKHNTAPPVIITESGKVVLLRRAGCAPAHVLFRSA